MRLLALLVVLALAAVVAVVLVTRGGEQAEPEPPAGGAEIVHVELLQVADPTVFGTARFEELDGGRTRVTLEVVPPPVGEQAARLGAGDCTAPSEAVHELPPVTGAPESGEPGRSSTELDVALGELVDAGLVAEVDTVTPEPELALCGRVVRR